MTRSISRRAGLLAALGLLLAACGEQTQFGPIDPDRFYFPNAVAIRHAWVTPPAGANVGDPCPPGVDGCHTQLFVASTNFDLRYDPASGGYVSMIDVEVALSKYQYLANVDPASYVPGLRYAAQSFPPPPTQHMNPVPNVPPQESGYLAGRLGVVNMGSYAGELAILEHGSCSEWSGGPQVLVPSRRDSNLYRMDIGIEQGPQGDPPPADPLLKPAGSPIALHGPTDANGRVILNVRQPYGIAVACGEFSKLEVVDPTTTNYVPNVPSVFAFVSYLETEDTSGVVTRVDLQSLELSSRTSLGISPVRSLLFDPAHANLWMTASFAAAGLAPLRWLNLATPRTKARNINLETWLRGVEPRGFAISSDGTRAYVALGVFDETVASYANARPLLDSGGALAVLDLTPMALGGAPQLLSVVSLDRGSSEVRAIPRAGRRDLVAVVNRQDATLALYDDELGAVANVYGIFRSLPQKPQGGQDTIKGYDGLDSRCADPADQNAPAPCFPGQPLLGAQPAGIAVETLDPSYVLGGQPAGRPLARIYVASSDRGWVNVITMDPMHPQQPPVAWARIGPERL